MGVLLAWLWWRGGILHSKSESGDDMTWDAKGYRLALNGNTFAREWTGCAMEAGRSLDACSLTLNPTQEP